MRLESSESVSQTKKATIKSRRWLVVATVLNDSLKKMSKRYSEINIPVVIVTGDQDKIVSPKENAYRLQAALSQSRLIELKETGHEIPQTHPESVYAALTLISLSLASR
jgi:pimeloyl-ACP methyl ester carboxylesterase